MKKLFTLGIIMFAIMGTFISAADAQDWAWSPTRNISSVYPYDSGLIFVLSGTAFTTNSTCTNRFAIDVNDSNYNTKVATLLTAYSLGTAIRVVYDDTYSDCNVPVNRFVGY